MPDRIDQREAIAAALKDFESYPLPEAATRLFKTIGYESRRTVKIKSVADFRRSWDENKCLTDRECEALNTLSSLHLLFQLTDAELTNQTDFFNDPGTLDGTRIHSYLFFAVELPPGAYTRTALSSIARAINKPLPMPALVLFHHGDSLSLAILHRRLNKRENEKDVIEKATLIKDIRFADPIRAHLEILNDFVFTNLDADFGIHNFVGLHNAWQKRLGTFALNETFYREIADWYFWAQHLIADGKIVPPKSVDTDPERSLFLIRVLTRLIFCWFLIEKRLIPADLFRENRLKNLLNDLGPDNSTYYRAILQNLFFGTLNQPKEDRDFRGRSKSGGLDPNRGITNLWRYEDYFRDPAQWRKLTERIPFLNGGLFDCLDRVFQKVEETPNARLDGFSDNPKESAQLPNYLFFDEKGRIVDLSKDYGEDTKSARSRRARVRGLIDILSRYKFTIEENTPLDEEIALDPELLGRVFENLLASYNPETKDTARKQTGSFYTPREVVAFMVDEALIAYLEPSLEGADPAPRLRALFDAHANHFDNHFSKEETERLVTALDNVKILDPACGSGAFPMGALHRLVDLLAKLDPENQRWESRQRARLQEDKARAAAIPKADDRQEALAEVTQRERELIPIFNANRFDRNYARKLFLIENDIFGVDIQPVAVQIAKLRFFIALICDQKVDVRADNMGVLPLPNLETRIVAANTLLPIGSASGREEQSSLLDHRLDRLRAELREIRHEHFQARSPDRKRRCRERDAKKRAELAAELRQSGMPARTANELAEWNPYDQNTFAPFFDPLWMFGDAYLRGSIANNVGFDIVVGNPPYVRQEKIKDQKEDLKPHYPDTFTGTADLFVFFYDRALQLLRRDGILSYITSNKWYRAAYGEKLRAHLGKTVSLLHAIDFGDAPVFTAIAYPTIIIARKSPPPSRHTFRALNWDPQTPNTEIANFEKFYETKSSRVMQSSLEVGGWRFLARKGQDLLDKIRAAGKPLGEFVNGRFYYGIKTGLNDAFVVDRATRDRLISEDPKSVELLKPYLRGRDIKRWRANSPDLWLIFSRHGTEIAKYPAIKRHLAGFREKLEPKPRNWPDDKKWEGRKPGTYAWFEIQDNVAYWEEFETSKVITGRFMDKPTFCFDCDGYYHNNANSFIAGADIWLAGVLNSPLAWYFLVRTCTVLQNGYLQAHNENIAAVPVASPSSPQKAILTENCGVVQFIYGCETSSHVRDPLMLDYYEELLNALVYELYLPEDLHNAGLHFFDLIEAAKLPDIAAKPKADPKAKLRLLRDKFEELYTPSHPLRAALQKLHTLDPIRIIEGKA
jgi:type I restriction-modification system DNA methylase subunit